MQTASGYTLYYTPVPCLYAFAPCLCMYTPVVYSGIIAFTLYIYDAPNKLFKEKKEKRKYGYLHPLVMICKQYYVCTLA